MASNCDLIAALVLVHGVVRTDFYQAEAAFFQVCVTEASNFGCSPLILWANGRRVPDDHAMRSSCQAFILESYYCAAKFSTPDYMAKPVSIPEWHARVTGLLQSTYGF